MKCINESCRSEDLEIIKENQTTIIKKVGNGLAAGCALLLAFAVPHYAGAISQISRKYEDNVTYKSAIVVYRCRKCGCTFSKKKLM